MKLSLNDESVLQAPPKPQRAWMQLNRTFGRIHRQMEKMLSRHKLTGPQFDVLSALLNCDGCAQQELAEQLLVTKGNIAVVIDNLEAMGLVERRPDDRDGRVKRVFLAPIARERLRQITPDYRAILRKTWSSHSTDELKTMTDLLAKAEEQVTKE